MTFAQALLQVAEEYRADGYDVVVAPPPDQRPDFANDMDIDLLAYKNGEKKAVVEVKLTRQDLIGDQHMVDLARRVEAQPDWRFDLVVLNRDAPEDALGSETYSLTSQEIEDGLETASGLLNDQKLRAALLQAWSLLEALLRRNVADAEVELENYSTLHLLETACVEDLISISIYHELIKALRVRDAIAHGLNHPNLTQQLVAFVLQFTRSMMPVTAPDRLAS